MGAYDNCCFCISLKTGCLIIGYMHLFGCVILTVVSLAIIAITGIRVNQATLYLIHDETSTIYTTISSVIVIFVALFILTFIVMLLVGIHKNKPELVMAYLVFDCISLVFYVLGLILYTVYATNWYIIVLGLIFNFLTIYCIFVIVCQYIVMHGSGQLPYHALPAVNSTYSLYIAPTPPVYNDSRAVYNAPSD